jgi:hypothetical protein
MHFILSLIDLKTANIECLRLISRILMGVDTRIWIDKCEAFLRCIRFHCHSEFLLHLYICQALLLIGTKPTNTLKFFSHGRCLLERWCQNLMPIHTAPSLWNCFLLDRHGLWRSIAETLSSWSTIFVSMTLH